MKFFKTVLLTGLTINDPVACQASSRDEAYNRLKAAHPGRVVSLDQMIEITREEYNEFINKNNSNL